VDVEFDQTVSRAQAGTCECLRAPLRRKLSRRTLCPGVILQRSVFGSQNLFQVAITGDVKSQDWLRGLCRVDELP
jgi:hypothetical protein